MKLYTVKVVSDVVCRQLFKDFNIDDGAKIKFSFVEVDQFIPGILTVDAEMFLIVHISPFAFNTINVTNQYNNRIQEIMSSLQQVILNSSTVVILNSIYIDAEEFSQDRVLESRKLAYDCNKLIEEFVDKNKNRVILVDIQNHIARVGSAMHISYRNYGIMRMPYSKSLSNIIRESYYFHLKSKLKARKKVILVDADNTLWGGVVGEEGVQGIYYGHEYPGINFVRFQEALIKIKESGVLICLITKNNLEDVLEVFNLRQMAIKADDFLEIKANWNRKSENIKEVLNNLNLDESAALFIDDSPFEIEEVRRAFPGMECLQFDSNDAEWVTRLHRDSALYCHYLTSEDRVKTDAYKEEKERRILKDSIYSIDDYIVSLSINIKIYVNDKNIIPRISQLTQKTNQFNLTTKRYTDQDIEKFMNNGKVFAFSVCDRFGELGIVGVVIVLNAVIDTFLLSCRAFGRGVENTMLCEVLGNISQYPITAKYIKSTKNMMVRNFYNANGFSIKLNLDDQIIFEVCQFAQIKKTSQIKEISWN
jgi:FkbH-like protein